MNPRSIPQAKITNKTVLIMILGWSFAGIIVGLYMLGVFTGYVTTIEPFLLGMYALISGLALLAETVYEAPGIKGLDDLTPRNILSLIISFVSIIVGFAYIGLLSNTYTIPTNIVPLVAIVILAVSTFMAIETRE
jgi:hypothetical protein